MAKGKTKSSALGSIAVILAAALWGCIGIFSRDMTINGFTVMQTVGLRALITVIIMLILILIKSPSLLKIRFRDIWMFIGTGICSFLFFNFCYMNSINENSLSVACILLYTSVFWVTLLSAMFFHEKLTVVKWISLIICFGGSALICMSGSLTITTKGLIFGLLSGLGYGLYSIFGKCAVKRYHSFTITFYTFLFATLGALPFIHPTDLVSLLAVPENIYLTVGIAVVNTILPYLLYTYGLSRINAGKAAVLAILEPVVAAIIGHFLFSEYLDTLGIIGIIAVGLGFILLEHGKEH